MSSSRFRTYLAVSNLMQSAQHLRDTLHNQHLAMEQFTTLRSLRQTVAEFGFTKSLMSFANRNNMLAQISTALPATESLDNVPLSKKSPRHVAALEGLDESLSQESAVVGSWTQKLGEDLDGMFASTESVTADLLTDVHQAIAEVGQHVLGGEIDTMVITARSAHGFDAIFTALTSRVRKVVAADADAFMTSPEYRAHCVSFIEELVEEFRSMIGCTLQEGEFVHAGADEIDEAYVVREGSLVDLGYDTESLTAVLENAAELLDAVRDLCDKRGEIVGGLAQIAERMPAPTDGEGGVEIASAHQLVSNYAAVIVMLLGDSIHHVHEAMAVAEHIVAEAAPTTEDGRSD